MNIIQHCLICRPSDFIVSEDAGIEPRTVAALALTARRSITTQLDLIHRQGQISSKGLGRCHPHSARSHPHSTRSHPHLARSHPHSTRSQTHSARPHPQVPLQIQIFKYIRQFPTVLLSMIFQTPKKTLTFGKIVTFNPYTSRLSDTSTEFDRDGFQRKQYSFLWF